MHVFTSDDPDTNRSTVSRRLFAGGMLATLATAGISLPAAAQGLKSVEDDDDRNDRDDDDESADLPETWEEIGVTGEFTYESPQYGYSIEWEEPWTVDPMQPGMTDPENGLDDLTLKWDGASRQSIKVTLLGLRADPMGLEGFSDYMTTGNGRDIWESSTHTVEERFFEVGDTSFELLFDWIPVNDQEARNWVYLAVVEANPDAWLWATMVIPEEFLEDTYKDFSKLVAVEGESLIRLSTWRDIERAIR